MLMATEKSALRGENFRCHRIAWVIFYGKDPGEAQVDHIDRNKSNNKIENLRLLDQSGQAFNHGKLELALKQMCWKLRRSSRSSDLKGASRPRGSFVCPLARSQYLDAVEEDSRDQPCFCPCRHPKFWVIRWSLRLSKTSYPTIYDYLKGVASRSSLFWCLLVIVAMTGVLATLVSVLCAPISFAKYWCRP